MIGQMLAMRSYVFGYGSLINLESAEKTLGRMVNRHTVLVVDARSYSRLWRVVVPVVVHGYSQKPVNGVFLDIEEQSGKATNGILIAVNDTELANLDAREKHYNRIDITERISPPVGDGIVFAYQGKPEFFATHFPDTKILNNYLSLIHKGVRAWGKEFSYKFDATTQPHSFEVIDGVYQFCDKEQNRLTGRG